MTKLPPLLVRLQDKLSTLLGCAPQSRAQIISAMLHRNPAEATGYWLQLVVSVGIATFGLALGSSAVVIAAMLIAPLMGPIVNLGMGLAVGSPFLVIRSAVRVTVSVGLAIGLSALMTRTLPFHEINQEIAARTAPTVLDLLTAAFCALAGVYASMQPSSNVASTAAGTSIGISLVPPLCASGYGLGTSVLSVAWGASLLFLANFVSIVVVGTLAFTLAGFNQVDVKGLEAHELGASSDAPVARRLASLFASKAGPWLRLLMPLALMAAVYAPLRQALDEVAWQIRARKSVETAIHGLSRQILQSNLRVERGTIDVSLVLVGTTNDALAARKRLDTEIQKATNIIPRLDVFALPDAAAFAGLEATLAMRRDPPVARRHEPPSVLETSRFVADAVKQRWPASAAGPVLEVSMSAEDPTALTVYHLGRPLEDAAREVLAKALSDDLGQRLKIRDVAFPREDITAETPVAFIARVAPLTQLSRTLLNVWVCIGEPPEPANAARGGDQQSRLRAAMKELIAQHPRARSEPADVWRLRFSDKSCVTVPGGSAVDPTATANPTATQASGAN
jgi:uncharacterized hydrophobic protein (TIGR00271 family)